MAKKENKENKGTVERWTYIGRRATLKGPLAHFWLDAKGEERGYGKLKGSVVGGVYEVTVFADGVSTNVGYTGEKTDDEEGRKRWALEDRAAYTGDELRKLEQRDRREGSEFGDLTIIEFARKYRRSFGPRRAALLAQLLQYLGA